MKRHLIQLLLAVPVICSIILCGCNSNAHKSRIIPVETPARPAGQKDVLGLRLPPIDTIRVGFIGLGMRGEDAVYRYTNLPGVEIKALCDLHQERADSCQRFLRAAGMLLQNRSDDGPPQRLSRTGDSASRGKIKTFKDN